MKKFAICLTAVSLLCLGSIITAPASQPAIDSAPVVACHGLSGRRPALRALRGAGRIVLRIVTLGRRG